MRNIILSSVRDKNSYSTIHDWVSQRPEPGCTHTINYIFHFLGVGVAAVRSGATSTRTRLPEAASFTSPL